MIGDKGIGNSTAYDFRLGVDYDTTMMLTILGLGIACLRH